MGPTPDREIHVRRLGQKDGGIGQWMIDELIVLRCDLARLGLLRLMLDEALVLVLKPQIVELQDHWDPKLGEVLLVQALSSGSTRSGLCLPLSLSQSGLHSIWHT